MVTDNLHDFAMKDAERIDTRVILRPKQPPRQLCALIFERPDGVAIAIAHPIDAIDWLRGRRPANAGRYPEAACASRRRAMILQNLQHTSTSIP